MSGGIDTGWWDELTRGTTSGGLSLQDIFKAKGASDPDETKFPEALPPPLPPELYAQFRLSNFGETEKKKGKKSLKIKKLDKEKEA